MVTPSTGKTPQVAGMSCKDIRDTLTTDCSGPPPTGAYWVNVTDSHCCPEDDQDGEIESMRVYCEMSLDGGGWTLVWKHSYMEVGPLTESMKYFSNHPRSCTDIESGWCNVPYKCRLKPINGDDDSGLQEQDTSPCLQGLVQPQHRLQLAWRDPD